MCNTCQSFRFLAQCAGDILYRGHHHGYEPVLGVRAVGDTVVTGGILGSMAVLRWVVEDVVVVEDSLVMEDNFVVEDSLVALTAQ